jgi:hypothetical protein
MRNDMALTAWSRAVVVIIVLACVLGAAGRPLRAAAALSATDYIEIQQLVARTAYALDTAADKGKTFAALFTADGTLRAKTPQPYEVKGRDQLAAFAMGDLTHRGPAYVREYVTNHVISSAPEGATGRVYLVWIEVEENGRPGAIQSGGRYEDVYVKTPAGWRIKARTLVPSKLGPRVP